MPKRITSSYWRRRETRQRQKNLKDQARYDKEIRKIYLKAIANIEKEIYAFYSRYARKEGITFAEARKRADKLDIEAYAEKAKRYVATKDFSDEANEEMRLYNLTMKVNRLELLKANLGLELVDNFNDLQQFFEEKLTDRTMEEFERLAGILGETVIDTNPAERAKVLINASFHNATWSDRIWMYQDLLKNELDKLLRTGLIQGRNPNVLARDLRKIFDVSRRDAERLMHTELARVQTAAQKDSFERNGFEAYEFICCGGGAGTNPNDPCPICKSLDGKQFKIKDMMIGENAPPVHPRCHCSTAAVYMSRADFDRWLDAKEVGKTDLGAKEWEEGSDNKTGSGALQGAYNDDNDPLNEKRTKIANDLYAQFLNRKREYEIKAVSKNSGFSYDDVDRVFAHVFEREHLFEDGSIHKFHPDYYMAHSWMRLREGKNIQEHDMILFNHELEEEKIMGKNLEIVYEKAHNEVEKTWNYRKALLKYLKTHDV